MNKIKGFFSKKILLPSSLTLFSLYSYTKYIKSSENSISCRDKDGLKKLHKNIKCYSEIDKSEILLKYPNLSIVTSSSFINLLNHIRDKTISTAEFRRYSKRLIRILIEEGLALEYNEEIIKESPCGYYRSKVINDPFKDFIAVSILRSGDAILEEVLNILPDVKIGKILVQRNEESSEKEAIYFFEKLPQNIHENKVLLLDPMVATGGSAIASIRILLKNGIKQENILFLNIISCEEGISNIFKQFPNIRIISGVVDPELLSIKYIAPGLGDFGDRFYGTDTIKESI